MPPRDPAERIYRAIMRIPRGRVATYGQIARAAGLPRCPRLVGRVLAELPARSDLPWHRVVNASGRISRADPAGVARQRRRLEQEGVSFTTRGKSGGGRIELVRFRWSRGAGKDG